MLAWFWERMFPQGFQRRRPASRCAIQAMEICVIEMPLAECHPL
jgi:hypothetical protein